MTHLRILACLTACAMLVACSQRQDETSAQAPETRADAKPAPAKMDTNDGGIPLSATKSAAVAQYKEVRKLADQGDFIKANQVARRLTEDHPDFAGGWIMLGNTALSGEQFVKATRKAVTLATDGTRGEQLWADINMSFVSNDAEQGLELGKELVDTYPESPRAWMVYSGLLGGQNKIDDARKAAGKAIQLAPKQASAHVNLGFSYLNNSPRDFAKAEQHFKHAVDLDPGNDNYWVNVGDAHRAMGDLQEARGDYSKASELNGRNEIATVKRAHVNSFLGNFDEARADYDKSVAMGREGNKSTLANFRAFVNLHAGDNAAAVGELKSELQRIDTLDMPEDQKVGARNFLLANLADICFNSEMLDEAAEAVEMLSASLAESGRNSGDENYARQQKATATYWRAKLAVRQGDYAAAKALAEEFAALVANDDNPRKMERYHEVHGLAALMQKDYEAAIEHYRQANLSTSPGGGDVKNIYMLAQALEAVGETDEASELLDKVANWNFNSAWFAMLRKEAAASI